ncbi:hypothetical protein CVT24_008522 [Panaeolus cyanescens]|uniref:Uncharacterized protein n=1 Tax=Panaeolus cyanescens TaxID=181874 RepID=A0A409VKZ5_9AGAR|nr:hypothetical protein CVT24_008522 [Panaeolus cyanescens]
MSSTLSLPTIETYDETRSLPLNDIVPSDIWQEVFRLVCQNELKSVESTVQRPTKIDFPRSAFNLSHVCRHWHGVITSQPLLWRNLFIHVRVKSPDSLLQTCLSRTGDVGLRIFIVAYKTDEAGLQALQSCFYTLQPVSNRWKYLSLAIGDPARKEFEKVFFSTTTQAGYALTFRSLEFVGVSSAVEEERLTRTEYAFIGRFCEEANLSLGSIRIGGYYRSIYRVPTYKVIKAYPRLQESLTSLSLVRHDFELDRFLVGLSKLSKLEHLGIERCSCYSNDSTDRRITLPHLRSISISDLHHRSLEIIFSSLLLPALEDVTFGPPLHTPGFREMANQSGCKIRRFCMTADRKFYDYLVYFLAAPAFSHLEELTLEADEFESDHVRYLELAPGVFEVTKMGEQVMTPLFPATLKRLTLLGCVSDDGLLGQVAKTRMMDGPLEFFYAEVVNRVSVYHEMDDLIFRELRRSGFDAELRRRALTW